MPFDLKLDPDETLIATTRRSLWFLFKNLVSLALIALILPVFYLITAPFLVSSFGPGASQIAFLLLVVAVIVILLITIFFIVAWFNEKLILTNERLIAIPSAPLIWDNVAELQMSEIVDVQIRQRGFGPIFGFGDLNIKAEVSTDPYTLFSGAAGINSFLPKLMAAVEAWRKGGN